MSNPAAPARKNELLALAGPTAVGKSEVALCLAERLGGEIISVDSMQVYRGMDIGTAKPSAGSRTRVPHHLLDILDITESFDAAQFVKLATQAVSEIHARERLPILCGGTGLYFKVFFHGLGRGPGKDPELRSQLEAMPISVLLGELAEKDPEAYAHIDRQNARRVIRALEVIRLTGKPYSQQRADWSRSSLGTEQPPVFGLMRAPEDLHHRIEDRVDAMFQQGLLGETEALLSAGLDRNRTAMQALGYRQVVEYLEGIRSLPDTIALVKTRTRQYAKRQMTWFRNQLPLSWVDAGREDSPEQIAEEMIRRFKLPARLQAD